MVKLSNSAAPQSYALRDSTPVCNLDVWERRLKPKILINRAEFGNFSGHLHVGRAFISTND